MKPAAELSKEDIALLVRIIDEEITELKRREQYLKALRDKLWVSESNSAPT